MSTYEKMLKFLSTSWSAKKYIVPCLVGPAGIGKTAAVKQHAADVGANVVTIIASQILPNEVSGITMPVPETKAMEIYDHYRLSSLKDGDILFFDELLEADQLVLSACLTLIESRQLMSGTLLPDIQIVAATNPTISPMMLKENIRQRFVFMDFEVDPNGTREFIAREYGFDIGDRIAQSITDHGDEYNILTPRSLTKMAAWIADSKGDVDVAHQINYIWNSTLGTSLRKQYFNSINEPERQFREAVREAVASAGVTQETSFVFDDKEFAETTIEELMDILKSSPGWEQIEHVLSTTQLVEEDGGDNLQF